jgi:hypothetical protein
MGGISGAAAAIAIADPGGVAEAGRRARIPRRRPARSGSRLRQDELEDADRPGEIDMTIVDLVRGADIMIYDSTYTDEEYPTYKGWGHSTWQEGVRVANAAGVRTLVLFHHDPNHDDVFMDQVAREAEAARPGTVVAREGMVLRP